MQQIKKKNMIKLGKRIKAMRISRSLNINEIVNLYGGISVANWSRIEAGKHYNIELSTLIIISKAFSITIDELLKDINFDYTIIE